MSKRRALLALVTAALTVPVIALAGAPAQAAGFTTMSIWNSSHCLDNATENAAKLQMWNCTGGPEQKWLAEFLPGSMYRFVNQNTGRCITGPTAAHPGLWMDECNLLPDTQKWRVFYAEPRGLFKVLQNVSNGQCMTTSSVANGTQPRTTACDSSAAYERWH
ncbi:RICIN domain-containing protein [Streptomyces angustmyceticus]|uniref:RICIN domain-containing protein n=1 Tax=Streptomyces angustmyceticus TaxID=285578 RepID=UPI0038201E0C